tara:strand:- start:721 stop:1656 length:936 start_codon:yes stop_codon:yes gene_type:complete
MKIKKYKDQFITSTNYWSFVNISTQKDSTRRKIKYFLNKYLAKIFKLKIISSNSDVRPEQRSYTKDSSIIKKRNSKISDLVVNHFSKFNIYLDGSEVLVSINEYDVFFRNSEISDLNGGMGYNNGLILYILCKYIKPLKIIESGVWRGYTTFLLDKASPINAEILCYDINLRLVEFKSKKASYYEADISEHIIKDHEDFDLAFFDDHVSHYDRLNFCLENNIKYIILDDDVSAYQTHSDGWPPIPTAAMIYDFENIPQNFEWVTNDIDASADISSIDVKPIIEKYTRVTFPSLSVYTGYRDTSFTSLIVKK